MGLELFEVSYSGGYWERCVRADGGGSGGDAVGVGAGRVALVCHTKGGKKVM